VGLKRATEKAIFDSDHRAGAKAHVDFVGFVGMTEVMPSLQPRLPRVFRSL
jgi:hypothetical protein